jgi:hypothetical protein
MENKNAWWIAGIAGVVAVALVVGVAIANSGGGTLEGPTWTLSSIADPGGGLGAPLPDVPVTAQFANDEVTGSAGCNNYFGGYQTDGDAISIGPLGATRAFCEGIQDQEDRYLALLQAATSFSLDGSTLRLSDGGATLLEFEAA